MQAAIQKARHEQRDYVRYFSESLSKTRNYQFKTDQIQKTIAKLQGQESKMLESLAYVRQDLKDYDQEVSYWVRMIAVKR